MLEATRPSRRPLARSIGAVAFIAALAAFALGPASSARAAGDLLAPLGSPSIARAGAAGGVGLMPAASLNRRSQDGGGTVVTDERLADDGAMDAARAEVDRAAADAPRAGIAPGDREFGEKGARRFHVHLAYGEDVDFDGQQFGIAGVGVSWFIEEDLSLDLEFNAFGTDQTGNDAAGFNFNVLLRWHFLARETWSIYLDGGAGMLITSSDVPEEGSSFNFTPQAGVGASFDVWARNRLLVGARWQHISNANLYSNNPGRDSVMAYVGLSIPF